MKWMRQRTTSRRRLGCTGAYTQTRSHCLLDHPEHLGGIISTRRGEIETCVHHSIYLCRGHVANEEDKDQNENERCHGASSVLQHPGCPGGPH